MSDLPGVQPGDAVHHHFGGKSTLRQIQRPNGVPPECVQCAGRARWLNPDGWKLVRRAQSAGKASR